jgi:NAD(P)-dependent dehydrogenase (short-subunit alcohol dehydrogenase family)
MRCRPLVVTSSGAGVKGIKGQAAHTAAKHGVVGLTKAAALNYAQSNVRINAVCPGIIDTAMMQRFSGGTPEGRDRVIAQEPVGRMGTPEEIAVAVVWLCSDAAAIAGGVLAHPLPLQLMVRRWIAIDRRLPCSCSSGGITAPHMAAPVSWR